MANPPQNSLVLYKNKPAIVSKAGDKLELILPKKKSIKVRPKDVDLLHPGPVASLKDLTPQQGEVETAWELLAGETVSLADLADLIYESYTPATAWAAWQLVDEGLYFEGTPNVIRVCTAAEVTEKQAVQAAKAQKEAHWNAFLERVKRGKVTPEDTPYLQDIEKLAYDQQQTSALLKELGRPQTPQSAHALLLKLGYWSETHNPYPRRLGLSLTQPALDLPPLPPSARHDLTHLTALAIDDAGSTDPDDAISLEPGRLWVHIADVAALISPGSPADLEAQGRAANLYLPEETIHMLPPQATHALALGLSEKSPALSFGLDLNEADEVTGLEVMPSWISVTRLSYEQAEDQLNTPLLSNLHRLAQTLRARREDNGAIELDLPEVKIRVINEEIVIKPILPLHSRNIVQEAMLVCGEAVAEFALRNNIPIPFSAQPPPLPLDDPLPDGLAGMFALRRTLKASELSAQPAPHSGLGLAQYVQVTSPLRRYADLLAHQQLRAFLAGQPVLEMSAVLERLGAVEALRSTVRQAERLSNRHWTLVYLQRQAEWTGEGIVVEKRGSRALIVIPSLDVETRLHLRGNIELNATLNLRFNSCNLPELEGYFQLI